MRERTPAPTGVAAPFSSRPMSAPKSRPNPDFAIGRSLFKELDGDKSFFEFRQKLDNRRAAIILGLVILTKIFVLKLLLGLGFGLIILALL